MKTLDGFGRPCAPEVLARAKAAKKDAASNFPAYSREGYDAGEYAAACVLAAAAQKSTAPKVS